MLHITPEKHNLGHAVSDQPETPKLLESYEKN